MRNFGLSVSLLVSIGLTSGCSQTGWMRLGGGAGTNNNTQTVASVGDRSLPAVSGEPGSSVSSAVDDGAGTAPAGARISGRVFDENGQPVSKAKVRLAVSSSPGGKINYATTDQSGGFTLRGLRAGTPYTVIAEYQGEEGIMTGRVDLTSPRTNVSINLQPRDSEADRGKTAIRPARPKVAPVSRPRARDEDEAAPEEDADSPRLDANPPSLNSEDLDLPAAESTAARSARAERTASRPTDGRSSAVRGGWSARQPGQRDGQAAAVGNDPATAHDDASAARPPRSSQPPPDADDDGPNPLPPAAESGRSDSLSARDLDDGSLRVARGPGRSARDAASGQFARGHRPREFDETPADQAPRPIPEDILPGAQSSADTPPDYEPTIVIGADDSSPAVDPTSTIRTSTRSSSRAHGARVAPVSQSQTTDPDAPVDSARRPTWRELSSSAATVPLDESIRLASGAAPAAAADSQVITLTSATQPQPPKLTLPRLLSGARSKPKLDPAVTQSVCRIDQRDQRLVDFALPGLDGKMVSLHNIDADVILLDFWGSWCKQAEQSSAHLNELNSRLGGKRFQVVGIACEKGSTPEERQATAAKGAKALGITYPVLVTSMDGNCPVQKALQVQFYPTMILIDRQGRLIDREQGATDLTLARLDHAIGMALGMPPGAGPDDAPAR